jgi:hypothetical protein
MDHHLDEQTYIISFDNVSLDEANRYASELQDVLLDADDDVTVDRRQDNPDAQDFGATLVLIFGTQAALAIAKGIANWLQRRHEVGLTITTSRGKLVATNLTSTSALQLADRFLEES